MNLVSSLYNNISTNKYVSSSLETIKKNTIVSSGLEIYSIAKEVYETVKNEPEEKSQKIEEIYLTSTQKLTNSKITKIKKRIDYRIVKVFGEKSRLARELKNSSKKVLKEKIENLNKLIKISYESLKENFTVLSAFLKINLEKLFKSSPQIFKDLLESLQNYSGKFMNFNSSIFKKIQKTLKLTEILNSSEKKLSELKKLLSSNLKSSFEAVVENKKSLKNLFLFSFNHLKLFFSQNWTVLQDVIEINGDLIKSFFKKLEFDVYYSKNECFKPVNAIRGLYEDIMTDRASCENYDEVNSSDGDMEEEEKEN